MSVFRKDSLDELLEKAALEIAKQECELSQEAEEHVFSEEYRNKMAKLFLNEEKKEQARKQRKYVMRAACFLLVCVLCIAFVASGGADAFRIKFMNFVHEISRPNSDVNFFENGGNEYSDDDVKLKYIPMGFELAEKEKFSNHFYLVFSNGKEYFQLDILSINSNPSIDTENGTSEKIEINNYEAIYTSNENVNTLTWSDDEYIFMIMGNIEKNEIIKIAEKAERY